MRSSIWTLHCKFKVVFHVNLFLLQNLSCQNTANQREEIATGLGCSQDCANDEAAKRRPDFLYLGIVEDGFLFSTMILYLSIYIYDPGLAGTPPHPPQCNVPILTPFPPSPLWMWIVAFLVGGKCGPCPCIAS